MKCAELQIVASTAYPGKVSLRTTNRTDVSMGLRDALTAAGFRPGERVVVVAAQELEALLAARRGDPTVER